MYLLTQMHETVQLTSNPFFLFSINHHLKASTHKRVKPLLNTIHPQRWNKNNPARQAPRKLRKTLKLQTTVQTSLIHTTVPPAGTSGFWIFQKTRTQNLTGEQDQHNEWKHTCHDDNPEFFGISNHYKMPPFQSLNEERRAMVIYKGPALEVRQMEMTLTVLIKAITSTPADLIL